MVKEEVSRKGDAVEMSNLREKIGRQRRAPFHELRSKKSC